MTIMHTATAPDRAAAPILTLAATFAVAAAVVGGVVAVSRADAQWCATHGACPPAGVVQRTVAQTPARTSREAAENSEAARAAKKPGFVPCP